MTAHAPPRPDRDSATPLVGQIGEDLAHRIRSGMLRRGARLPSIRRMARECGVSTLTIANTYLRLAAAGLVESRGTRGYFVCTPPRAAPLIQRSIDSTWLLQYAYEDEAPVIKAGCGWLPSDLLFTSATRRALAGMTPGRLASVLEYGNPYGHAGLRHDISQMLARRDVCCEDGNIIMTHGASQALELAVRCLSTRGDTVLVEDPGYCNLYPALQSLGLRTASIPRLPDGPCPDALARMVRQHQPRLFITTSILHNPTGSCATTRNMHAVLDIATRHDLTVIEDDIFLDLAPEGQQTLSQLGGLERVVHIGSFSKTIAPGLRVGYVACASDTAQRILRQKMASNLTTAPLNEEIVHAIVSSGLYRPHLAHLREHLTRVQARVCTRLGQAGMAVHFQPPGGMFAWARFGQDMDVRALAERACQHDIMLAPGHLFRPGGQPSQWFRFNVAHCEDERLFTFIKSVACGKGID
ncbi:PLP-dependent aminotransferase family protein [Komagataeibacter medellinensis]|uniref:Transcriptional regulator n=2 Tax=Komagataeibacter medellinensis TaxID=1177712 RepID=G2I3V4_KOMMN|nr:PLP-dependent aminotransferase family protein [Komagataeibacter medellinensis]KAB8122406.1 PLP-dependent aminotransferase family protein [Komagataeibacter medellinensis]BAK82801.1 transcriptional regulator [Komagataeibacter medellinensis NBRC 3288]